MRRWLSILGGAALLITIATPAEAERSWQIYPFNVSPVAGPAGTDIAVDGDCQESQPGVATLRYAGTQSNVDLAFFGPGPFRVTLTNPVNPTTDFPVELEVHVDCFGLKDRPQPFTATRPRASSSDPTILTTGNGRAHLKGFDENGVVARYNEYVFDWRGVASVATGDVDGDRRLDVVVGTAAEAGRRAEVRVLNPDVLGGYLPYEYFDGGLNVAAGDINGDGDDEIIVAAGAGGGPHVKVFSFDQSAFSEVASFFAYDPSFRGGVHLAAADVDGDGSDEIITGTGPGGGPHVKIFEGSGVQIGSFFAYDLAFRGGVNVAGARLSGARTAEIVTAPGPGGGPHVRTFNAAGGPLGVGFYAYDPNFLGGVSVAAGDVSGFSGRGIVTAPYSGGSPHVRVFNGNGTATGPGFYAYANNASGVRVAVRQR